MGGGRAGTGAKRGGPLPHSQFFYKNFFLLSQSGTQTKPEYYFSRRKTLKTRKSASFTGVI